MQQALKWVGRLSGLAGVLLALYAVATRLGGSYFAGNFQVGTLFLASTFAVALGALAYVAALVEGGR